MLKASSELCMAPQSSISSLQWKTTVVVKALIFKQIVGVNIRVKNAGLTKGTLDFTPSENKQLSNVYISDLRKRRKTSMKGKTEKLKIFLLLG